MDEARLRLYDYYRVSYFKIFIAVVFELFLTFVGMDTYLEEKIFYPYFSMHWLIRVIVFLMVARSVQKRLGGNWVDGVKAGAFVGFFIGIFFGLFSFLRYPTVGTFFDFLALPWQTVVAGMIITGGATFFLKLWNEERSKLIQ